MLVIIPHETARLAAWEKRVEHSFPVLADAGFLAATTYGVAFQCRVHTNTSNTPSTFLVGTDGIVKWAYVGQGAQNFADRPPVVDVLKRIAEINNNH